MADIIKLQASERVCNATSNNFSNSRLVRLVNKGTTVGLVTLKDVIKELALNINASANGTTLLTLGSGNTEGLYTGLFLYDSTNTAVVNTDTLVIIDSIVNTTAVTTNLDIIIANGTCNVFAVDNVKTVSVPPNHVLILEKGATDVLTSNNNADVLGASVSVRG